MEGLLLFVLLPRDKCPATSGSLVDMVSRLQNNCLVNGGSSFYWRRSHSSLFIILAQAGNSSPAEGLLFIREEELWAVPEPHSGCTALWLSQFSAGHIVAPSQLLKRHKTNKQTNTQEASLFSLLLPTKKTQVLVLEKRGKDGRGGENGWRE